MIPQNEATPTPGPGATYSRVHLQEYEFTVFRILYNPTKAARRAADKLYSNSLERTLKISSRI
jgi:hypothetical protein